MRLAPLLAMAIAVPLQGAVLFPAPLHLVRRMEEPAASRVSVVEEFCQGNRVVTIARGGRQVTIADYDAQKLTEISHERHEYSVTPFADLARVTASPRAASASIVPASWQVHSLGVKATATGRNADRWELSRPGHSLEVGFDRSVPLSRAAAEVLIGAAYPNAHRDEHDAILHAARQPANASTSLLAKDAQELFALPVEQTIVHSMDGASVTIRMTLVRIDAATVPPDLLVPEAGSKLVESRALRVPRELAATEQLSPRRAP